MIFVVAFDRSVGRVLRFEAYDESRREEAEDVYRKCLSTVMFDKKQDVEVNMFEAESEKTFRKTHSRYFQTIQQTIDTLRRAV